MRNYNRHYENMLEDPKINDKVKQSPRIFRHFNYSRQSDRAYRCEFVDSKIEYKQRAKVYYIKGMYAKAHGIQIGHLRIYFSGSMPVGLYHPNVGPLCMENIWTRETAYHLNRVNRDDDTRLSPEVFHTILNDLLKKEVVKDIKLYIQDINDFELRTKLRDVNYISSNIW